MSLSFLPLWLSGILVVAIPTAIAMLSPGMIRRRVGLDRLRVNNEVAGFKFATVGVLYAVLLAFVVIVVWEKFSDAEQKVDQEAGAIATLYRISAGLDAKVQATLREKLDSYAKTAVESDWPAMAEGRSSPAGKKALDDVYAVILKIGISDARDTALLTEALRQIDLVTQARRDRLIMATGIVPGILWIVLCGRAVLTIGFTLFFGTENIRVQMLMTGILSILVFSGLWVIVAIDHPFAGTVKVGPEALVSVMEDFGHRE